MWKVKTRLCFLTQNQTDLIRISNQSSLKMLSLRANLRKARKGDVAWWVGSSNGWLYCIKREKSPWELSLKSVSQTLFFLKSAPLLRLIHRHLPPRKMVIKWVSVLCSIQHALISHLLLSMEWARYNPLPSTTSSHSCYSRGEVEVSSCLFMLGLLTFYRNFVVVVFIFVKPLPST